MSIWKVSTTPDEVNEYFKGNMCEFVGLKISEIGPDYLVATMPVNERTMQHMGIIHGGASVVLAETAGSVASTLCCPEGYHIVGLEINANHLRAGRPPYLSATARPLHIGSSTMVWDIRITDVDSKLVCVSRISCAVLENR